MQAPALPIDSYLPALVATMVEQNNLVLSSPPGSGKTTRVPAALLDTPWDGQIVVLEPRRLAARAAARRVSMERESALGEIVGYQVRHDRKVSSSTMLRFVTEGILLRQILSDPYLEGVACVILDEFHERHIEGDLALAMLREIQQTVRPDLRILVMSATLEPERLRSFLGGCPEICAEGETHLVELHYLDRPVTLDLLHPVRQQLRRALADTAGDVLVFLPGMREIQEIGTGLADLARSEGLAIQSLHGGLSCEQQDLALAVAKQRRVILATNIAESSVTIPGVSAVIDSGLARVLRHDLGRGLDVLRTESISHASAEQRRGRAGRTGPGVCYRLWAKAEDRSRPAQTTAEVQRIDLAGPALQVRAFAARPPAEFSWFEAPASSALEAADRILSQLGAVKEGRVTELGQEMLALPLHPRLARMMVEAKRRHCLRAAAGVAALLSERDIRNHSQWTSGVDIGELLQVLAACEQGRLSAAAGRARGIRMAALQAVCRVKEQIAKGSPVDRGGDGLDRAILAGFPDRLLRLCSAGSRDAKMVGGGRVRLRAESSSQGELFLALETSVAGGRGARTWVGLVSPVAAEWLADVHPQGLDEQQQVGWDEAGERIRCTRSRRFLGLVLEQLQGGEPDPQLVQALFLERLSPDPYPYLGPQKELHRFLSRLSWLRREAPELELPELGSADVALAAAKHGANLRSLRQLRSAPILPMLRARLGRSQSAALARLAPERLTLPSGRRAAIDYSGHEPVLAARIGELYGMQHAPGLLVKGDRRLLLHLLAPNHRPVQITRDLASFWKQIYPSVRIELRRKYPRHSWPEDPLRASPEAGPGR